MSKISKDEVRQVANLAKLYLTEEEIEKYQKELSGILSYIDLVATAPEPEEKIIDYRENILREDKVEEYKDFTVSSSAKTIYGFKKTDNN